MSISFRATAVRLAVVATAIVLAGGGAAASWAMSRPKAGTAAAPPPVDHQLCYSASGTHFKIPSGVKLINQFSPKGFVPKISSTLFLHCNPAQKTLPSGRTFKITNPNAHLGCFAISAPKQPTPTVVVTNQFGSATLVPGQPNALCVPSWKSLTGPPDKKPTTPPGLSHFACYPVRIKSDLQATGCQAARRVHQEARGRAGEPGAGGAVPAHGKDRRQAGLQDH